ncbi:hypothetical protein GYMLUDRAFT_257691 [Collybiopsis luxurians FD-317 M1]|nr:hypothetical protein GYMLUDRAFT_257691 [Collybiopsis luxurians FD-317 M1]
MPVLNTSHTAHLPRLVADLLLQTSTASPAAGDSGSCNRRTRFQIIWSCIAVLVACTWVSVHPNIPGPKEGMYKVLARKIGLMILSLVAPELLVMWAARQTVDAWLLKKKYSHQGWTTSHAMFALMGGFVLYKDGELVSVLRFRPVKARETQNTVSLTQNTDSFYGFHKYGRIGYNSGDTRHASDDLSFAAHADFIGRIPEDEIKDRSHVDWFGKLVAIGQTSWFITQLLARWVHNLATTELEIMTVAFATLNFIVYFLWWDKPQGVGCHIRIPAVQSTSGTEKQENGHRSKSPIQPSSSKQQPSPDPQGQSIPFWMNVSLGPFFIFAPPLHLLIFVMGKLRKAGHFLLGLFHQNQTKRSSPNNPTSIGVGLKVVHYIYLVTNFLSPTKLFERTVLRSEGPPERILSFEWDPYDIAEEHTRLFIRATSLLCYATVVFGAIHCAAWNFTFPTFLEQLLWRIFSLVTIFSPVSFAVFHSIRGLRPFRILEEKRPIVKAFPVVFNRTILLLYISARLALIIQSFLALRDLPPSALQGVVWSNYIPHI